jgi:hypothetical protein
LVAARGSAMLPVAPQRHPPPEPVPGRPHRGRLAIRLRPQAPAEEHGDCLGVARVMFGLAAVDRLHLERVAEDNREAFVRTQVGAPGPT